MIYFDTNKLPLNFNKWIKLNTNEIKNKYANDIRENYLLLNIFKHVVIESQ